MLQILYSALLLLLTGHGLHRAWLAWTAWRLRDRRPTSALPAELPRVTVQLPVFNERDVVARLVDAVARLDWPADRLQIQLLDDSTDDTAACARAALARARAAGIRVEILHREDRRGFKAGALAAGLDSATGEFIAIFDADFVPAPDFLRVCLAHFTDPGVGMVQARWDHLNADGPLTLAQAVMLDGHFRIEHLARNRGGLWFNFNGTAGVWRRAAIEAAGGWQHDTLTEDLDLSYRAQLAGWRFVYAGDHGVPAELPPTMGALLGQQRRWAKGSLETARKLRRRIFGAPVPLRVKLEALAHLHANLTWPLGLGVALLLPGMVLLDADAARGLWIDLPAFAGATLSNVAFYLYSQRGRGRGTWALGALALGVGLAWSQSRAVVEALRGRSSAFVRTPKRGDGAGSYRPERVGPPVELALAAWQAVGASAATAQGAWGSLPFLLLFFVGFAWVGGATLRERRAPAPVEPLLAK